MWLLPTRNRPDNLRRFFEAYHATGGTTPGMVLISKADLAANALDYAKVPRTPGWVIEPTDGETQGEKIAEVWEKVKDCGWLGLIGDDCVPTTMGWDAKLVDALDGANIVSCDDGWQAPERMGNCWIISGEIVRAVGYIFPPGLQHLFVDDVWEILGRDTGRWTHVMDVLVEHRHVLKGAAEFDDTHYQAYGNGFRQGAGPDMEHGFWAKDQETYAAWLQGDYARAVMAIKEVQPFWSPPKVAVAAADTKVVDGDLMNKLLERAKTRRVMFLTPIFVRPAWQYDESWTKTIAVLDSLGYKWDGVVGTEEDHEAIWDFRWHMGGSDLPSARNALAAMFLASRTANNLLFTDAMLMDDDMGWSPQSILRCLASEQAIIAGAGRKRDASIPNSSPSAWCCYFGSPELKHDEMGAITSKDGDTRVGTAFMRIKREVFELMMAEHPEWKADPPITPEQWVSRTPYERLAENYYEFFARPRGGGGEDFDFCRAWAELGGEVYVDPSIVLGHVGEHEFKGSLSEIMHPAPTP